MLKWKILYICDQNQCDTMKCYTTEHGFTAMAKQIKIVTYAYQKNQGPLSMDKFQKCVLRSGINHFSPEPPFPCLNPPTCSILIPWTLHQWGCGPEQPGKSLREQGCSCITRILWLPWKVGDSTLLTGQMWHQAAGKQETEGTNRRIMSINAYMVHVWPNYNGLHSMSELSLY